MKTVSLNIITKKKKKKNKITQKQIKTFTLAKRNK